MSTTQLATIDRKIVEKAALAKNVSQNNEHIARRFPDICALVLIKLILENPRLLLWQDTRGFIPYRNTQTVASDTLVGSSFSLHSHSLRFNTIGLYMFMLSKIGDGLCRICLSMA
jgi:hypothetical protein